MLSQNTSKIDKYESTGSIIAPPVSAVKYSFYMNNEQADTGQFPEWLRRQIDRRGWSGAELGRRMDVPTGTVNNWLRGDRKLTDAGLIHRMATALNVHQDEILELLDLRDGGADRMSLAVRRLQPLIDSIQWNEGTYKLVESTLENLRALQTGAFKEPKASWEEEE